MLARPSEILPQVDEGTPGPGSRGCLSPGDCPGVGIQSGVPGTSAPFSFSRDASFPAVTTLSFWGASLPPPHPLNGHPNIYSSLMPLALAGRLASPCGHIDGPFND